MPRARVETLRAIAPGVSEIELAAIDPPTIDAAPGQYVSVLLPDGRDRRSYSIASRPGQRDRMTLLVRQRGASAALWSRLVAGAEIDYEGPRGDFRLADDHPGGAVFAATGVGVAPLFPMIEALLARPGRGSVRLFWGLDGVAELFWQDRLAALASDPRFTSRIVFTSLGEGFVTTSVLEAAPALPGAVYYLCGNLQMVRDVSDGLVAAGVDRARQIRTDGY